MQNHDEKGIFSFELDFLSQKIIKNISVLVSELGVITEWSEYSAIMDKNHPGVGKWLNHAQVLKKNHCWLPAPRFRLEHSFINIQESDLIKILKPPLDAKSYWDKYFNSFSDEVFYSLIQEESIEYVFCLHLLYASILFHWSGIVRSLDESTAIRALRLSSEYFDTCYGMVLCKQSQDRKNALSEIRVKAGRAGGVSKAEASHLIQEDLIALIKEKKPHGGWKSKTACIEELLPQLMKFVESLNIREISSDSSGAKKHIPFINDPTALRDRIYGGWSINNSALKSAFDKAVSRKKITPK
ncbi:hypothetical protein [Hafnia paralvei]|uniref:hypothetical protein n=1 Tax=Hafnia paralvei TaxID=546367 RepID=UPI0028D0D78E|nr:hypothetical protein [Hafnia paralvei]